ncbi:unnamed protein product, partial [Mesorhabditis belari]|uniref:Uncharacterized protein n=1 Tax=Mesorhabditis belari TaxID=2138241 RepID=A0AAF3FDK0_9BILA
MKSLLGLLSLLLIFCLSIDAYVVSYDPQQSIDEFSGQAEKRMSRQTLIRLMMQRDRNAGPGPIKRSGNAVERRSIDQADDFQNCFLSPVQCMISRNRRR